MLEATLICGWFACLAVVASLWRSKRRRELSWERWSTEADAAPRVSTALKSGRRLRRRWRWVPWVLGSLASVLVWLLLGFTAPYVIAMGAMVGLLASQVEAFWAGQVISKLESQLADSIDIMIGAVGAGASVDTAIAAAITESRPPLKPYLEEVAGRIRLGDEPVEVFRSFAERVPLETFLLFTSALSVHWEVGGKLSSTLSTVGKTIRDRIEVSRRIRSNIAQSQFSTYAILGLTYFIAIIVWRNGTDQMEEFVTSSVGSWFVAGSILLQAIGIVWMNVISKPKF